MVRKSITKTQQPFTGPESTLGKQGFLCTVILETVRIIVHMICSDLPVLNGQVLTAGLSRDSLLKLHVHWKTWKLFNSAEISSSNMKYCIIVKRISALKWAYWKPDHVTFVELKSNNKWNWRIICKLCPFNHMLWNLLKDFISECADSSFTKKLYSFAIS